MIKPKKIVMFPLSAKGGIGKTAVISSLADFYKAHNIRVCLIDCDDENRTHGSLSHAFKATPKLDIRTHEGLDMLVTTVMQDGTDIVLADLGGGSGKETFKWFDDVYDGLKEEVTFLGIGILTNDVSTAVGVLHWASILKARINYFLVRNHMDGSDFHYLFETESGKNFLKLANPSIIDMEERSPHIQSELVNRGLSLRQALDLDPKAAGPILGTLVNRSRCRSYVRRIEEQFSRVVDVLLPAEGAVKV